MADETVVPFPPARGAETLLEKALGPMRLCATCKHREAKLSLPTELHPCRRPGLPLNLASGKTAFPCIIARGYDELCGPVGQYWEYRG